MLHSTTLCTQVSMYMCVNMCVRECGWQRESECTWSEGSLSLIAEATRDIRCSCCNHSVHKCPNQKSGSFWRAANQYHKHHQGRCSDSLWHILCLSHSTFLCSISLFLLDPCQVSVCLSLSLTYGYWAMAQRPWVWLTSWLWVGLKHKEIRWCQWQQHWIKQVFHNRSLKTCRSANLKSLIYTECQSKVCTVYIYIYIL